MLTRPWNKLPDEPAIWYDRFATYLLLGPQRTVKATWLHHDAGRTQSRSHNLPGSWSKASTKYQWRERAAQWDEQELSAEPQLRMLRSSTSRRRRLQQIQTLLDDAFLYLEKLKIAELSPEEALKLLPTLRPLLADLLRAYQKESESLPETPDMDEEAVTYWDRETYEAWREAYWIERSAEQKRIYEKLLNDLCTGFDLPENVRQYRPPGPTRWEII